MELVVVNGANAISRSLIRSLAKSGAYNSVKLVDFRPFRRGVYALQKELGVPLHKQQVQSAASLDIALEGAQDVLFLPHDYTAMTSDKNSFLEGTAKLAKKHGVQKLVAVCPIELDLYWSEDDKTPFQKKHESQQNALQSNSNMLVVNTDIVFGRDSYLTHYMAQCIMAGSIPTPLTSNIFKYNPVHSGCLGHAVQEAFAKFETVRGGLYAAGGPEQNTLSDIANAIQGASNKPAAKAKSSILGLGISDFVEEFFVGITHDKNMCRMAEFFDKNPQLKQQLTTNCLFQKLGIAPEHTVSGYYGQKKLAEQDFVFPTFTDYKLVCLD